MALEAGSLTPRHSTLPTEKNFAEEESPAEHLIGFRVEDLAGSWTGRVHSAAEPGQSPVRGLSGQCGKKLLVPLPCFRAGSVSPLSPLHSQLAAFVQRFSAFGGGFGSRFRIACEIFVALLPTSSGENGHWPDQTAAEFLTE